MGDIIRLLPDSVANQIAAGEVIQRPASVVKELVENSLDAGATYIQIFIVDAGKTCIQVIDNGMGMSETDARLAFERHATSKIAVASDLFDLRTMGFRGEALASIAAVAQVELRTRTVDNELGVNLRLSGSKIDSQEPVACDVGANFSVRNLFFNVPARRKFLKSNQAELNNIIAEFERIALSHCDIRFLLSHNDTVLMKLIPTSCKQRIVDVLGKKLNQQLLTVQVDTTLVRVFGFVGIPESSRKKSAHQYFFVNGRFMRHPYFHRAIMGAYERLIPIGEQIPYFVYLEVEPSKIDVNIHPTKTEIKFEDEQAIWQILNAAVKEALGKGNSVPSIDFESGGIPQMPVFQSVKDDSSLSFPSVKTDPRYTPFKKRALSTVEPHHAENDWQSLLEVLSQESKLDAESPAGIQAEEKSLSLYDEGSMRDELVWKEVTSFYSYKGTYIISAMEDGLMILDQHRAHIRILYDKYKQQVMNKNGISQRLLFPEIIDFSPSQLQIVEELSDELSAVGFDLSNLGGTSYAINGIPTGIEGINPVDLLHDVIAGTVIECRQQVKDEINHLLALSLAQKTSMPYGRQLSNEQMELLFHDLFACEVSKYTPDGKIIFAIIKDSNLKKMLT